MAPSARAFSGHGLNCASSCSYRTSADGMEGGTQLQGGRGRSAGRSAPEALTFAAVTMGRVFRAMGDGATRIAGKLSPIPGPKHYLAETRTIMAFSEECFG